MRAGGAAVLIVASDASANVAAKLVRLASGLPTVTAFTANALSAALGRENVTYVVVAAGEEAARFLREATRLAGFKPVFAEAEAGRVEA